MHRFHLPPAECQADPLTLAGREAHHALHVLRVRTGEEVTILDGAGQEFLCRVENFDRDKVHLAVLEKKSIPAPPCQITLLQAVPKGKIIESIIQKATELGVARIVPLLTERTVMELDEKDARKKAEKWQQIAMEAIKQCGAAWLPQVELPVRPEAFLARKESFELPLIASLHAGAEHPRNYFQKFELQHGRKPRSACIWIGPEGDFTPGEVSAIVSAGALPITLGRLVLRVETAATYCLSILNYEIQAPA
ncbi:MAG TPA: RsmE family RNA methyltransferase [Verrucomicrobiae bacterium]|jgi:16S rRNA (uracil1498-N3)-methyltransferase|nr:RsmE family RNA methyltransferase [Verrucomicrobiae bacterium]